MAVGAIEEGIEGIVGIGAPADEEALRLRDLKPGHLVVRTHTVAIFTFPNVAYASVQLAVMRETWGSTKLRNLSGEVKKQLANIDLLLDLNTELTALPDKDSHELTPKMRGIIAKLEESKIDIWKGGEKISKEKLGEFKAHISSQVDKLRTALQTTISTEIQPEANNLQSIMNIVQQIIQSDARMKRKTTEIPR